MKAFMDKDFLLSTETSKKLFHEYAETMPIVDYHWDSRRRHGVAVHGER